MAEASDNEFGTAWAMGARHVSTWSSRLKSASASNGGHVGFLRLHCLKMFTGLFL